MSVSLINQITKEDVDLVTNLVKKIKNPDFKTCSSRLATFSNWPDSSEQKPESLILAGFFYNKTDETVKCFSCSGSFFECMEQVDPILGHSQKFRRCKFIQQIRGFINKKANPKTEVSNGRKSGCKNQITEEKVDLVSKSLDNIEHPHLQTCCSRFATFSNWPQSSEEKPENLVLAGFFYMGINETIICFSCSGSIFKCTKNEDPISQHSKKFPHCTFIQKIDDLINKPLHQNNGVKKHKNTSTSKQLNGVVQRQGAVDLGRKYEALLPALVAIRCVFDENISNFSLLSNVEGFGDFDDLILSIEYKSGSTKMYCVQLKHISNHQVYMRDIIKEKDGNFSLNKYKKSYEIIKNNCGKVGNILGNTKLENIELLLYTNTKFVEDDKEKRLIAKERQFKVEENLLKTSDEKCEYCVFTFENGTETKFQDEYLEKIVLITQQSDAENVEHLIFKELSSKFEQIKPKEIENLVTYFADWATGNLGKHYPMCKSEIEMKLLEVIISPYLVFPNYDQIPTVNETSYKSYGEALSSYEFTLLENDINIDEFCEVIFSHVILTDIWKSYEDKTISKTVYLEKSIIKRKKKRGDLLPIHVYMIMWEFREVPLIIKSPTAVSTKAIKNILNSLNTHGRKFCIISSDFHEDYIPINATKFTNLNHLPNHLRERLYECIKLSLQGRLEISLLNLISTKEIAINNQLSPSLLFKLLSSTFEIGRKFEKLPYYVPRRFKKNILSAEVLTHKEENIVYLIFSENSLLIKELNIVEDNVIHCKKISDIIPSKEKFIVLLTKNIYDTVVNKMPDNIMYHALEFNERVNAYEWLHSTAPINKLRQYLVNTDNHDDYLVRDDNVKKNFKSHCHIISNNAGMGKTTMLNHFAQMCKSNIWILYINLPKYIQFINDINDFNNKEIAHHFLDFPSQFGKDFTISIFEYKLRKREVLILIDGYDEIQSENGNVEKLLDVLYNYKTEMWIATRSVLQKKLEDKFNSFSLGLTNFNKDDQLLYFEKYIMRNYSQQEIHEILKIIKKSFDSVDNELIEIPLQTRMITDIFNYKGMDFFKKQDFTIINLYEEFLQINTTYFQIKQDSNLILTCKLALSIFFSGEILKEIIDEKEFLKYKAEFVEEIKSEKRQFIISGFADDGVPIFAHRTYAEFLVAKWIADNSDRDSVKKLIKKKLFFKELNVIRQFFDGILSQGHPLHQAVLSNDIENLKSALVNNDLNDLDNCGRTALHLAASYGKIMDFTVSEECCGILNKIKHTEIQTYGDLLILEIPDSLYSKTNSEEIFTIILEAACSKNSYIINQSDAMNLTTSEYAFKSGCLRNLNQLCNKGFVSEELIESNNLFYLFHCLENGLNDLLMASQLYCLCKIEKDGKSLLCTAVKYCNENVVRNILKIEKSSCQYFKNNISDIIESHYLIETILERSDEMVITFLQTFKAFVGWNVNNFSDYSLVDKLVRRKEVFKKLLDLGLNIKNNFGSAALSCAAETGVVEFVEQLLNAGVPIDTHIYKRRTPLFLASWKGHLKCVQTLLQKGASTNIETSEGETPLYVSAIEEHTECMKCILQHKSDNKTESIFNVMIEAVIHNKSETVQNLLKDNAKVKLTKMNLYSVLNLATKYGHLECMKHLGDAGANKWDSYDLTRILDEGVRYKRYECVGMLLKYTSSYEIDIYTRNTYLHMAVENNDLKMLILLLQSKEIRKRIDFKDKDSRSALHLSAKCGYQEYIEQLIQNGAKTDNVNERKETPLWLAFEYNQTSCMKTLINLGALKNTKELHIATARNNTNFLKILIENGAIINYTDELGNTPLHIACKNNSYDSFLVLLNSGANINAINVLGITPHYYACYRGHYEIVEKMSEFKNTLKFVNINLEVQIICDNETTTVNSVPSKFNPVDSNKNQKNYEKCIDIEKARLELIYYDEGDIYKQLEEFSDLLKQVKDGFNDLHVSILKGHNKIANILIENGFPVNSIDNEGVTPIYDVISRKNGELFEKLLQNGALVNIYDCNKDTPINNACIVNWTECVEKLLDHKANLNKFNSKGCLPIHIAALTGSTESLDILLKKGGCDVNIPDLNGRTSLHFAAKRSLLTLNLLLESGANINLVGNGGETPVHNSIAANTTECLKKLLSCGGSKLVNTPDKNNQLPLHYAAYAGKSEFLKILLHNGADVNFRNILNMVSLHYAAEFGYLDCVKVLLQFKADVNICDDLNFTPLMYAAAGCNSEIVRLLLENGADAIFENQEGKSAKDMIGSGVFKGFTTFDSEKKKCLELLSSCGN